MPNTDGVTANNAVRVPMTDEQKRRLDQMAQEDRRKLSDFIRILIDDEWERRRQKAARV